MMKEISNDMKERCTTNTGFPIIDQRYDLSLLTHSKTYNDKSYVNIYAFRAKSPVTQDQEKVKKVIDDVFTEEFKDKVFFDAVNEAELDKCVIDAFCKHYPNPNLMEDTVKAFNEFTNSLISAINWFHEAVGAAMNSDKKKPGSTKTKKPIFPPIKALTQKHIEWVIRGYYDIINFVSSLTEKRTGVVMCQSKDEERDWLGLFHDLNIVIDTFLASMEPGGSIDSRKAYYNLTFNVKTEIYNRDLNVESMNKYFAKAVPCGNGVYHPDLYDKEGLISYRDFRKKYGVCMPMHMRAEYKGKNHQSPTLEHPIHGTFNTKEWLQGTYCRPGHPEDYETLMAMYYAVAKPNDMANYPYGIFFLDNGIGNTGKSSLLNSFVSMVGYENTVTANIVDIESQFGIGDITNINKMLVAGHENEPNDYNDTLTTYKCLVTGDPVKINDKFEKLKSAVFRGRIMQAMNGIVLRSSDNTESTNRRKYPYLMKHRMDNGDGVGDIKDNKSIKKYWIQRQEVADFLLTEAINLGIDALPITEDMLELRNEMAEGNNPILKFVKSHINTLQQNHFELQDLYPLYKDFCRANGYRDAGIDKFVINMNNALRSKDSQWDYNADPDRPDKFKPKNFDQYHVPLKWKREADPNYQALKRLANGNDLDPLTTQAKNAIVALYDNVKPGTKRNNAYFRKPQYEAETLIEIAKDITGVCHNTGTAKEAIEKLREYKYYTMEFKDGDTFGVDPVIKIYELGGKTPGCTNDSVALWDTVENRLAKLGKTIDIDAIIAHMDSEFEVDDEDELEKIGA